MEEKKVCDCGCEDCDGDCADEQIVELEDENGKPVKFSIYAYTEYEGKRYVGLLPVEESDSIKDDELVIFALDEANEEISVVEDDALADAVFNQMMEECDCEDDCDCGDGCDCEDCKH